MRFDVISLFPEMFSSLQYGVIGRAIKNNIIQIHHWNPRNYTLNKNQQVDDKPYGGGPGMVMAAPPLIATLTDIKKNHTTIHKVIYLSPQGKAFNQKVALEQKDLNLVFIAGRYEGIDQRFIDTYTDEEWSIGDYILSGGELAAMVIIDTITRLLPNVLGDENSVKEDSLMVNLLKYPQYTRPENIGEAKVPNVLLSGDHQAIFRWRLKQSLGKTWLQRKDLLTGKILTAEEQQLLKEFIDETNIHRRNT